MLISPNPVSERQLKRLQLSILGKLDKLCADHQIVYCLYYGSLLGCIRHSGYIPWDDDIDVAMPRDDYQRFITLDTSALGLEILSPINTADFPYPFGKISLNRTVCVEEMDCTYGRLGIHIDVFPLDTIPRSLVARWIQDIVINALIFFRNAKIIKIKKSRGGIKAVTHWILKSILKGVSARWLSKNIDLVSSFFQKKSGRLVGCRSSIYRHREVFPAEIFANLEIRRFESLYVKVPCQYDAILRGIYGDYATPPNIELQVSKHSFRCFTDITD